MEGKKDELQDVQQRNVLEIALRESTIWDLCCFCQNESQKGSLVRPYLKACYHKSYTQIQKDVKNCKDNEFTLPFNLAEECLITTGYADIETSLLGNKAVFHKKCRDEIGPSRVDRFLMNKRKTEDDTTPSSISPKKTRRSYESSCSRKTLQCFYCLMYDDDIQNREHICKAGDVGNTLKELAHKAENWTVYARLSTAFDNTASDINYHKSCYAKLQNEARSAERTSKSAKQEKRPSFDPLVIAELLAYIKHKDIEMKLVDLKTLYEQRLIQINSQWVGENVHATRFKDHLIGKLGDGWQVFKSENGKNVILSRNENVAEVLLDHMNAEDEAQQIVEVGLLLRKKILVPQSPFSGTFSPNCLRESVPNALLTLMRVLLEGAGGIGVEENSKVTARMRVALTLSQLVISNSVKESSDAQQLYQVTVRETPFPLYTSLVLNSNGRLKKVIKNFHKAGISVSHDRTLIVRRTIAQAVSEQFREQKVVVPVNCKRGVFTVGTTDNIDVSGRVEMHGTSITLIGQLTNDNLGYDGPPLNLDVPSDTVIQLPEEFAVVPYVENISGNVKLKSIPDGEARPPKKTSNTECIEAWLSHVTRVHSKGVVDKQWQFEKVPVTFSGYFSNLQKKENVKPRAVVGTFPVFSEEKADTMGMQKHAMKVVKDGIEFLNPGQTPIIEGDCPLYARQKMCQWMFPDEVGEENMVCMMGFLHLEMCIQEVAGKLLGGSGWERMFIIAKTHTSGVAASMLGGHKVKRTRHAYFATLAWLNILRKEAYSSYCNGGTPHDSMDVWEKQLHLSFPTACYWGGIVRHFLLAYCRFIHCKRIGDWHGCLDAIDDLCGYIFAAGQTNYGRWLPVFLRDMTQLPNRHPDVYENFKKGKFVVQRSNKKFSLMGLDQSQEHSIQFLKQDCGPKGLYGETAEKLAIELSRADVLRLIEEYEVASQGIDPEQINVEHPESSISEQKSYMNQIQSLLMLVKKQTIINPYEDTGKELVTLDTGECMDPEVTKSLLQFPQVGKDLYLKYVTERLEQCTKPISDVISKPKLYTFLNPPSANLKKGSAKLASCKASAAIVTQMFISLQARPESDMSDFFKYENSRFPPALSDNGKLRSGTKSKIMECLPGMPQPGKNPATKNASVVILDMPAVIHMVKPKRATIFSEYLPTHLLPFIESQVNSITTRVDAVWDRYPENSLKNQTRVKRIGTTRERRIRAADNVPIPKGKDWQAFLKISENKDEMFKYMSEKLINVTASSNYHLLSTKGEIVLSNKPVDLSRISPSDHEEADTRMLLHLYDAVMDGHSIAFIRTVDSDVIVICLHVFHQLTLHGLSQLWIGFGTGNAYKDIPIHVVANELGHEKCYALPFFHAFSGCDVTSSLNGIGKKTAWNAWTNFQEVTNTMIALTEDPSEFSEDSNHMHLLERLTVLMYSKNCTAETVNEARQTLFVHKLKSLESIPPTKAALFQHIKRVILVVSFIWHQTLERLLHLPNFALYGWEWNDRVQSWVPYWTVLDDASSACALLLHCGCPTSCVGNCKCAKGNVRCTPLCKCEGGCTRNNRY